MKAERRNQQVHRNGFLGASASGAIAPILIPVLFIVSWHTLSSYHLLPQVFPTPLAVISNYVNPLTRTEILVNLSVSLGRILLGFSVALAIGVPAGILIGWFRSVEETLDPFLQLLRPIAPFAWIPITIAWFGASLLQTVFIVAYAAFFPILLNTIAGVKEIDKIHLKAAHTLGAGSVQVFKEIILPASLPATLTGMRIGMGFAWGSIIAAEYVSQLNITVLSGVLQIVGGIGYLMITLATVRFDPSELLAVVVLVGLIGLLIDRVFRITQDKLSPWYKTLKLGI